MIKHILAVDPGKTSGYVIMEEREPWSILGHGHATVEGMADLLENYENPNGLSTIIYEDFLLFKGKAIAQSGSRFEASQVIGMLKAFARKHGKLLVRQSTDNRDRGYAWAQVYRPSDHSKSHKWDALAHASYYLITRNLMPPEKPK